MNNKIPNESDNSYREGLTKLKPISYHLNKVTSEAIFIEFNNLEYKNPIKIIEILEIIHHTNKDEFIYYGKIKIEGLNNFSVPGCSREYATINCINYLIEFIDKHNMTPDDFNTFTIENIEKNIQETKKIVDNILE